MATSESGGRFGAASSHVPAHEPRCSGERDPRRRAVGPEDVFASGGGLNAASETAHAAGAYVRGVGPRRDRDTREVSTPLAFGQPGQQLSRGYVQGSQGKPFGQPCGGLRARADDGWRGQTRAGGRSVQGHRERVRRADAARASRGSAHRVRESADRGRYPGPAGRRAGEQPQPGCVPRRVRRPEREQGRSGRPRLGPPHVPAGERARRGVPQGVRPEPGLQERFRPRLRGRDDLRPHGHGRTPAARPPATAAPGTTPRSPARPRASPRTGSTTTG